MTKRLMCMLLAVCLLIPCGSASAWAVKTIEPAEQMPDTYDYYLDADPSLVWPKSESWYGGYRVLFQNTAEYESVPYGSGTIFASACGPSAMSNVLYAAGIADINIKDMCEIAVACGARVTGGTNEATLLKYLGPKYNFTYKSTSASKDLKEHLQKGGYALIHAGTSYPLFTYRGHFMAAVDIEGDTVTLLDSYWQSDKYTQTKAKRDNVTVIAPGIIKVNISQIVKATADRSPCYYLLNQQTTQKPEEKPKKKSAADKGDAPFTDVYEGSWYYDFVINAYKAGLMSGTKKDLFTPDHTLTRAMVAQILYAYHGYPAVTASSSGFSDVKSQDWFSNAVVWAANEHIVSGYGKGKFGPNDTVTREQLAVILYSAARSPELSDTELLDFTDASSVHSWAASAMAWANQQGIITGTTKQGKKILDPLGQATRAQAATMMLKYINYV